VTAEVVAQAPLSGLLMGCVYALIAAGLSLIFGLMEIVNFAHGELLMLAMFATFWAWALAGLDPVLALPLATLLLFGVGWVVYRGVISRILGAPMLAQVFATFGLAVFLRSGAQFLWSPDFRLVQNPWIRGRFSIFGLFVGAPQLAAALAALLAFGLLYWFITRTETGLALQATAQDRQAAAHGHQHRADVRARLGTRGRLRRRGRRPPRELLLRVSDVGAVFALLAYVTVALGGFGNVAATLAAAPDRPWWRTSSASGRRRSSTSVFCFYLLVVLWRPQGLFGRY
jgi:branched-chain amino acid transport system permease protein